MAFDINTFVASKTKAPTGGFDVDTFLEGHGIQRKPDLESVEGLSRYATSKGLGKEVTKITDQTPRLSFLQRLGAGLGAFNPGQAQYKTIEAIRQNPDVVGPAVFFPQYGKDIVAGIRSAITGTDYQGERKTFADVAGQLGIENGIAKFGIGFAGDVLLDPTTYLGGAIAKGVGATVRGTVNVGLKGIGKIAPQTETGLRLAGTGIKEAFGKAFVAGKGASRGAVPDVLTFLSKRDKARVGLAASNLNRLGTGVLTKGQQEELALKLIAGKRAEFAARNATADQFRAIVGKTTPELDEAITLYGITKDAISNNPARRLAKYVNKRTGELPEALGKGTSIFGRKGDTIVTELGFDDSEQAREAYQLYRNQSQQLKDLTDTLKSQRASFKDEKALDSLLAQGYAENIRSAAGRLGKEATETSDPLVRKIIAEQSARSQKFGKQLELTNPYETYFPFIKKDKVDGFLKQMQSKGIQVGSEGYRKQFKNLLTNENLELNPAKAFFTSEAQQVSDRMTRDFLTGFAKRYGKPLTAFKNADEAAKAGYKILKEKGSFGRELGYIEQHDAKLLSDLITPEFQTINMLAKATGFDAITNLFKRSVTGLFVPFHVRNFVSGIIQNFEVLGADALDPKTIASGQKFAYHLARGTKPTDGLLQVAGRPTSVKRVFQVFADRFGSDTFYHNDFLQALDVGRQLRSVSPILGKESFLHTLKTGGLGADAIPFRAGRAIGQFIEHQQKATAYIAALNQGKTISQALQLAEQAGFDYRNLTAFESQIMRRLVPFYSFTRKNIELQLRILGENPQRINQVLAFFQNAPPLIGGQKIPQEEKQSLPDYLKNSLGIKLSDTPEGLKQYISSFGTPIEAFAQLINNNIVLYSLSQMNPLLKTPIEIGIGKDSFRQSDLRDSYNAKEYKYAPQIIKDLLEIKESEKDILKKGVDGKLHKVGKKIVYVANPERLLIARSLFTSRGVTYLDQIFGGDLQGFEKFLKLTTGIKPQQIDLEMVKSIKDRDTKRALEDLLTRTGNAARFTRTFVPKGRSYTLPKPKTRE